MKKQILAAMVLGVMGCAGARAQQATVDVAGQYDRSVEFNSDAVNARLQEANARLVAVADSMRGQQAELKMAADSMRGEQARMQQVQLMLAAAEAPAQDLQPMMFAGAPQVKDELFAGTEKFSKDAKDVTELNLDPSMLAMVGGTSAEAAKKMDFIVIHSYGYANAGSYNMDDVDAYRKKLADGSWNCFLHVADSKSGEKTDICVKQGADNQTNELVIVSAEPKELTFIHMKGRMSLNEMQRMSASTRMSARMGQHLNTFERFYFPSSEVTVPKAAVTVRRGSEMTAPVPPVPPASAPAPAR